MRDTPLVRRALWMATAACLSGGFIAIPVVDEARNDRSVPASAASRVSTVAPRPDGLSSPANGAPPASAPPAARQLEIPLPRESPLAQPTPVQPPEQLGQPADPGPTVPPRAGTYRYRYRQDGQESTSLTRVEDRGRSGSEVRQVITRQGGGIDAASDLSWRPDGAYVLKTVFLLAGASRTCDWEPDVLRSRLPLTAGASWEARSSCTMEGIGGTPVVLSYRSTATVRDLERVRVAGQVVDVWAVEETERFDFGGRTVDNAATSLVSPRHGVIVRSLTRSRDSGAGQSSYELELLNLDPE